MWIMCPPTVRLLHFSLWVSTYGATLPYEMESQKNNTLTFLPNPRLKLMDQVLRYHHYAYRTEQTYCQWILRHIHCFGGTPHPNRLGTKDVERFLSHLAPEGRVSASTVSANRGRQRMLARKQPRRADGHGSARNRPPIPSPSRHLFAACQRHLRHSAIGPKA